MASAASSTKQYCSCTEKALLQAIVDSRSDAAWFEDDQGKKIVCNEKAESLPPIRIPEDSFVIVDNVAYRSSTTIIPYKKSLVLKELMALDTCSAKIRASTQRLKATIVENQ